MRTTFAILQDQVVPQHCSQSFVIRCPPQNNPQRWQVCTIRSMFPLGPGDRFDGRTPRQVLCQHKCCAELKKNELKHAISDAARTCTGPCKGTALLGRERRDAAVCTVFSPTEPNREGLQVEGCFPMFAGTRQTCRRGSLLQAGGFILARINRLWCAQRQRPPSIVAQKLPEWPASTSGRLQRVASLQHGLAQSIPKRGCHFRQQACPRQGVDVLHETGVLLKACCLLQT